LVSDWHAGRNRPRLVVSGPGASGGSLRPELVTKLGVSLIFFLHGLTLSFAALSAGTRNLRLHLLVQLSTFLLFPLLGLLLLTFLGDRVDATLRTGLFFLCAFPSTVSSSVALTATAHGNVPAAVFNATLSQPARRIPHAALARTSFCDSVKAGVWRSDAGPLLLAAAAPWASSASRHHSAGS
jgi:hypothetical protein